MSLENEFQNSPYHPAEISPEPHWKARISYTREFLLSLSELDICKKLPSGFDQSILSELGDASQDRQRTSGGLSMHNSRRNEYGSSPPNRGDVSGYSRGTHGRWDSRSRDSDSQSDRDSDSGRRYGYQSRKSGQVPEHDGLLGSGSNPRLSGFTSGQSNPKFRTNDQYQLNRSNEPYHPPRPCKALPHTRRDNKDSLNDETFGSSEYTSEDKAEEERKRRASFELMRKEQLKAFQEKQTLTPEKRQDNFDITSLLDDPKTEKQLLDRDSESVHAVSILASSNEFARSLSAHAPNASRPLVPPGFSSTNLEKNHMMKSSGVTRETEVTPPEVGYTQLLTKGDYVLGQILNNPEKTLVNNVTLSEEQHKRGGLKALINNDGETNKDLSSDLDVSGKGVEMTLQTSKVSHFPVAMQGLVDSDIIGLKAEVDDHENLGDLNHGQSNAVLKKLLGDAEILESGNPPDLIKENKAEEMWSTDTFQSSKFAHWFTEEKKPVDDSFTTKPYDLLSLIVGGGEKGNSQVSDVKSDFRCQNSEAIGGHVTTEVVSYFDGSPEQLYSSNKQEVVSAVITCEDLEQSMLSDIRDNVSEVREPAEDRALNATLELQNANIDNDASQHLLFLLQKGPNQNDLTPSSNVDANSSNRVQDAEGGSEHANKSEEEMKDASNLLKTLTLETLFGSAFMKELQSIGAPVSVRRGSAGSVTNDSSEPPRFPFPMVDNDLPPCIDGNGLKRQSSHTYAVNETLHKTGRVEEQWLGYDEPQTEHGSSQHRHEFSNLSGHDGSADICLPEEDNLLTVSDPLQNFISGIGSSNTKVLSSMDRGIKFADNLAPKNAAYIDGRHVMVGQERQLHPPVPFNMRESDVPFQNFNAQRSSSQVHPSHLNHMRPMFNPLDSRPNINPNMNFINDNMIHRSSPPNHFPGNMHRPIFQHPSSGMNGFDTPSHLSMLRQILPGNFPPHLVRGFPGSTPIPGHQNNAVAGLMQESNTMQGFPFGHQHPNLGDPGMALPAAEIGGGNHPEALQRLIEMELRSNSTNSPFW